MPALGLMLGEAQRHARFACAKALAEAMSGYQAWVVDMAATRIGVLHTRVRTPVPRMTDVTSYSDPKGFIQGKRKH